MKVSAQQKLSKRLNSLAKTKKTYRCSSCGATSAKWIGRCPSCNEWNTFEEELIAPTNNHRASVSILDESKSKPTLIKEVISSATERYQSGLAEFDRILGNGIIPGSLMLLGGEPGIGKSTIALQIAMSFKDKVLYCSGEESIQQIKIRSERIEKQNDTCYVFNEQNLEQIFENARQIKPGLIVIDSIQTVFSIQNESLPGSVTQLRECTHMLMNYAKTEQIPIIIIGHITKDGVLAGPKLLEHMVDVVMIFEGDLNNNYRIIRTLKNRFGAVPELAVYEMTSAGLNEVTNPSSLFFHFDGNKSSGVTAANTLNGVRPIFTELQVLVSIPVYANPQRNATGYDIKRLNMLLAVIEKKLGFKVLMKDVFLNISGGLKIQDPASDLAIIMAVISSFADKQLDNYTCFCAEVSLTGELKPVNKLAQRIAEAEKIGFKKVIIPKIAGFKAEGAKKINIQSFESVSQVVRSVFAG